MRKVYQDKYQELSEWITNDSKPYGILKNCFSSNTTLWGNGFKLVDRETDIFRGSDGNTLLPIDHGHILRIESGAEASDWYDTNHLYKYPFLVIDHNNTFTISTKDSSNNVTTHNVSNSCFYIEESDVQIKYSANDTANNVFIMFLENEVEIDENPPE